MLAGSSDSAARAWSPAKGRPISKPFSVRTNTSGDLQGVDESFELH
jgi:hypothetical protein